MKKQYEEWIKKMFDKYKGILFIDKYHLRVQEVGDDTYLGSRFNYPYLDIVIEYSPKAIKDWQKDKTEAERRIIHEFCHTVTDPFYATIIKFPTKQDIENERERLTDHIAQIVIKLKNK